MAKQGGQTPLYEQVVKMVKDQIVSGVYTKGDLLPSEKEMIDNLGVSRITVRKALSILSDMGYIRTEKGRGSEVILDVEDLLSHGKFSEEMTEYRRLCMEATQIRILLEPEIARQVAIKATDEQLASLRIWENHIRMKNPTNEFHLALAEILGNQELVEMLQQLIEVEESKAPKDMVLPEQQEKVAQTLCLQHQKILRAIEARDAEFAYFYMKEHEKYAEQMYVDYFRRIMT